MKSNNNHVGLVRADLTPVTLSAFVDIPSQRSLKISNDDPDIVIHPWEISRPTSECKLDLFLNNSKGVNN
ncbi:hypothetical protein [Methanococcoides methylutens]|uniref:hypothetical protein n=1 Tax=Methanococcoides methylutens TaxID=2226 RepID=UPI001269CE2B|nr:hypothetical protein [Methanococcoides methylutens]